MSGQIIGPIGVLPTGGSAGPFTIDGSAVTFNSFATVTSQALPAFSTNFTNEIVYIVAEINGAQISSISDTAGLTWARRVTSFPVSSPNACELWSAKASGLLSGNVATLTYSGTNSFISTSMFAFSGANFASPYDPNASVPAFNDGLSPVTVTTTNATTIIIYGGRTSVSSGDTVAWSSGGGNLLSSTGFLCTAWKTGPGASGSQNANVVTGPGNGNVMDAITT